MEFLKFLSRVSTLKNRLIQDMQDAKRRVEEKKRAEEIAYAQQIIADYYVKKEAALAGFPQSLHDVEKEIPLSSDLVREITRRKRFDSISNFASFGDLTAKGFENEVFKLIGVDQLTRDQIHLEALRQSVNFWQDRIGQPVVTVDEIMLGRRRIIQLNERIEGLTKNPTDINPDSP